MKSIFLPLVAINLANTVIFGTALKDVGLVQTNGLA